MVMTEKAAAGGGGNDNGNDCSRDGIPDRMLVCK
jgi:hypothetical protein